MNNDRISPRQFQRMVMIELFSTASLTLPALVVRLNGKGGFIPLCLGSAMAFLLAGYYMWVSEGWGDGRGRDRSSGQGDKGEGYGGQRNEGNGYCGQGYSGQIMAGNGKWLGGIYGVIYAVRYLVHGFFLMVLFAALLKEALLPGQGRALILFPVLALAFYSVQKGLKVRARILELLFPYIFIPVLVVVLLALFRVDYGNLPRMLWGESGSYAQTALGAYGVFMIYRALEFILFLYPAVEGKKKKEAGFRAAWSCFFVAALHIVIYIAAVGMFGTVRTGEKLWSALYIMQSVQLPGHFLERLDILFLAFWIFSMFALFSGYLFYSEMIVCRWFSCFSKKGDPRERSLSQGKVKVLYSAAFLAAVFVLVLCFPDPDRVLGFLGKYMMWVDFPLAVLLPLLVRAKTSLQGKRKVRAAGKKAGAMLLCLVAAGSLMSGCGSQVDIEDRNYVLALGIDAGEKKDFLITYGTANLSEPTGQGEGGDSQEGKETSYEADGFGEAEKKDNKSDEKRLDYGHLKALLISKKVADDALLWEKIRKELDKKQNLSGSVLVFLTEGEAKQCIKDEKELNTSLGDYLEKMAANHKKDIREYTLQQLLRDRAEGMEGKIPLLKGTGKKIALE